MTWASFGDVAAAEILQLILEAAALPRPMIGGEGGGGGGLEDVTRGEAL